MFSPVWDKGGGWLVRELVFHKKFWGYQLIEFGDFCPKIGVYLLQNSLVREIISNYVIVLVRYSQAGKI